MLIARDNTLYIRQAAVTALKAAGLARVYGPQPPATPTWPFVRVSVDEESPFEAVCLNGSAVTLTVHTFAKGEGENAVAALNQTVATALHGKQIALVDAPYPASLRQVRRLRTQIIRDTAEATGWHGIVSFSAIVSS